MSAWLNFLTSAPNRASKSSRLYWNSSEDKVPPPSVSDLRKIPEWLCVGGGEGLCVEGGEGLCVEGGEGLLVWY